MDNQSKLFEAAALKLEELKAAVKEYSKWERAINSRERFIWSKRVDRVMAEYSAYRKIFKAQGIDDLFLAYIKEA